MSDNTTISDLTSFFSPESTEASSQEQTPERDEQEIDNKDESISTERDESASHVDVEEDESTVDNDSDDSDDEDDEDDSSTRTSIDDEDFTVTVDGEEVTVKGSELRSGYMRQAAFTKKTQEIAAERKALAAERGAVVEQANVVKFQAHTKLAQFEDAVKQAGGWENLRATYPPEQVEQFTQMYVGAQKEAQTADGIVSEYTSKIREQNKREIADIFSQMTQTINGFTPDTLNKMDSYLTSNGFTEEMALAMTHPQAWEMVYKAMKFDEAQSRSKTDGKQASKEKVESKKHHSAPATPVKGDTRKRKLDKAIERQKKSGGKGRSGEQATVDALVNLFGDKK